MVNNEREITITGKAAELRRANKELRVELEECRRVEQELRESESRLVADALRRTEFEYQSLVELIHAIVWKRDAETFQFSFISKEAETLFGYRAGQWTSDPMFWSNHLHPEDRNWTLSFRVGAAQDRTDHEFEYRMITADGRVVWLRDIVRIAVNDNGVKELLGVMVDITQRKLAEEALRRSEKKFSAIFQTIPDVVSIMRAKDWFVLDLNDAWTAKTGYLKSDRIGKTAQEMTVFTSQEARKTLMESLIETREINNYEAEYRFKDGSLHYGLTSARVIELDGEQCVVAITRDITDLKTAEEAIRQSEARFRTLAETTPSAIIVHRLDEAEILYVNPAMEEISGYSRSELLNLTLWDLIHPDCVEVVSERRLARLRGDMVPPRLELKLVTKGGEARWVDQSIGAIEFEGTPALIVTAFDVTDRKLAEEALRRSEERYRALVENTPDIIARYDRDGRYLFVNSAIGRVSPLRPEDFIGKTLRDIVFTQEQASFREEVIRKVFETGKPFETEFELQGLRGIDVYDWRVYPEFDSSGNMQSVLSINRNITERRRAAEALRLSEERYRLIVENQTEFIVKWLPDGTRTFVNESYCRYFGISEQECLGTSFFPLIEPEFREAIRRNTASLTPETPEYTEEHLSIVSNGKRWQQWTNRGIFDHDGQLVELLSTGRDITERKTAEEALQDSETRGRLLNERFSLAVDSAGIGVWDLNLVTNELSWDQQMYRLYQVDPAEFSGAYDAWVRGVHPDDLPRAEAESQEAINGARPFDTAFRVVWPNGEARYIRAFARVVVDERGSPIRMIGINYDITDRKRVEESLSKSEAHYRALVENTPDVIARFDRDCRYMFINSAVAQVSSIKPEDFVGKSPREVGFSEEQASFREGVVRRVFEAQMPFETEFEFEGADGRRTFEWRVYPEFDETGSVQTALSINRDITERRNAEVEVRQSREQLRALSSHLQVVREEERTHIAREVHDELGQALTALKIDLYSLQRDLAREAPSEANRLADKIKSMSSLIDTTIHAVRRIATELRPGILDDLGLVAAIEWQANDFQSRTGIHCEVASAVEYVELDRDRSTAAFRILQETLTNVARHASASRVAIALKQDDKNLVMEVTDNGKGITASDISGSKSLGLLGMCERAQLLGGDLMISGGAGEGTRVTVSIPL